MSKKLYARPEILLRNWLAGSKTVVSTSRNHPVLHFEHDGNQTESILLLCRVELEGPLFAYD